MRSEYKEWVAQYNESQPISFYNGAIAAWQHRQTEVDELQSANLRRSQHIDRLQKHNAKLQKRLKENGLEWKDLIDEQALKGGRE